MKRLDKTPSKGHTHKQDAADFNLEHAAKLSLADFQSSQAHQWPGVSDADRNTRLAIVHGQALDKIKPASNDISTPNGPALPGPESNAGTGDGSGQGSNEGSGPKPGAAVPAGNKGGRDKA